MAKEPTGPDSSEHSDKSATTRSVRKRSRATGSLANGTTPGASGPGEAATGPATGTATGTAASGPAEGTAASAEAVANETGSVTLDQAARPRGQSRTAVYRRAQKEAEAAAAADAKRLAEVADLSTMIKGIANMVGMAIGGPEGALNEGEAMLIDMGLPPLLASITPEVARQVQSVLYPGLVVVGGGAWALRVFGLAQARAAARRDSRKEAVAYRAAEVAPAPSSEPAEGSAPSAPATADSIIASPDLRGAFASLSSSPV